MTLAADQMRTKRQAIAAPGSALDRLVRMLAVGLPALVGVVAALMLITPLSPRGEISFLLDRNKVAVAGDRLRVDDAMYRGQDREGRPFSLNAGEAIQRSNTVRLVEIEDMTARILLQGGPAILSASVGTYAMDDDQVHIPGIVQFTASDGYEMSARNVTIDLANRSLFGDGRVSGVVPVGQFSADSMQADLNTRNITLDGNARMTMVPGQLRLPSGIE